MSAPQPAQITNSSLWSLPEGKRLIGVAITTAVIAAIAIAIVHSIHENGTCSMSTVEGVDAAATLFFLLPTIYCGIMAFIKLQENTQSPETTNNQQPLKKLTSKDVIYRLTKQTDLNRFDAPFLKNWNTLLRENPEDKNIILIKNFITQQEWDETFVEGEFLLKICDLGNSSQDEERARGIRLMQAALTLGANVNIAVSSLPSAFGDIPITPITYLITENNVNIELIELLLNNGAVSNGKYLYNKNLEKSLSPLQKVLTDLPLNTPEIVTLLLQHKASIEITTVRAGMGKRKIYVGAKLTHYKVFKDTVSGSISSIRAAWETKYGYSSHAFNQMLQSLSDEGMPE